jgi:hypothetical protein
MRRDPDIFSKLNDVTMPNVILLLSNTPVHEFEERILMMNNATNQGEKRAERDK